MLLVRQPHPPFVRVNSYSAASVAAVATNLPARAVDFQSLAVTCAAPQTKPDLFMTLKSVTGCFESSFAEACFVG